MSKNLHAKDQDGNANKPYGLWKTCVIVLCGHLGVRPSHKREEDFARANGLYVFAVALLYFALIIAGLIVLVNYIAP